MTDNLEHAPWYKNPMVWLVIALPSSAVIAGIITIFIAVNTEDGLVVDDYYKKGKEINMVMKHDDKAKELGLSAFVDISATTGEVLLELDAKQDFSAPDEVVFKLIHRTRSGQDQTITMSKAADASKYRGYLKPPVIEGRWTIHILSPDIWRLKQNFTTRSAENIILNVTS